MLLFVYLLTMAHISGPASFLHHPGPGAQAPRQASGARPRPSWAPQSGLAGCFVVKYGSIV